MMKEKMKSWNRQGGHTLFKKNNYVKKNLTHKHMPKHINNHINISKHTRTETNLWCGGCKVYKSRGAGGGGDRQASLLRKLCSKGMDGVIQGGVEGAYVEIIYEHQSIHYISTLTHPQ